LDKDVGDHNIDVVQETSEDTIADQDVEGEMVVANVSI